MNKSNPVIALVCMALLLGCGHQNNKENVVYRSALTIFIAKQFSVESENELLYQGEAYLRTQLRVLQSEEIRERAEKQLGVTASEVKEKAIEVDANILKETPFIELRVDSDDPLFAESYAKAMADAYLAFRDEMCFTTLNPSVLALTQQAQRLREELRKAERKVEEFERNNSIVSINEQLKASEDVIERLRKEAAEAKAKRLRLQEQQKQLSEASEQVVWQVLADAGVVPLERAKNEEGTQARERDADEFIKNCLVVLKIKEESALSAAEEMDIDMVETQRAKRMYERLCNSIERLDGLYRQVFRRLEEAELGDGLSLDNTVIMGQRTVVVDENALSKLLKK